ncbi:hypothetical protein [Minwuia sp. IMCC4030]|nr:hypothetical protein [Minwuia sp. IMCC4030]
MNAPWADNTLQGVLFANRARMGSSAFLTLVQGDGTEQNFSYDEIYVRAHAWAVRY